MLKTPRPLAGLLPHGIKLLSRQPLRIAQLQQQLHLLSSQLRTWLAQIKTGDALLQLLLQLSILRRWNFKVYSIQGGVLFFHRVFPKRFLRIPQADCCGTLGIPVLELFLLEVRICERLVRNQLEAVQEVDLLRCRIWC